MSANRWRQTLARLRQIQYQPGLLDGFLARTRLDLSNLHN
jgi:hypothetical protein